MIHILKSAALLVALTLALAAVTRAQSNLEVEFRQAVETEEVKGDLKSAIEQYGKVASGSNRALAAQALLRMADAYQKLGDGEAQRTFERIVREFSDRVEATVARARLGAGTPSIAGNDRIVHAGSDVTYGDGRVSLDGRLVSYVTYAGPKGLNLMLRDLVSGTERALTDVDWNGGAAYSSTFSPDGKQVAYGWRTYGPPAHVNELRVVSLAGTGIPQPRTIFSSDEVSIFHPTDWSRDGNTLAVRVSRQDGTGQVALIGLDGSFRALKTFEGWRAANKVFFSPDGKYLAYDLPASDMDTRRDVFILAADASAEVSLHDPADDVVMGWAPDGRHLLVASDRNGAVGLWAFPIVDGRPTRATPILLKADIGTILSQGLTAAGALYTVNDAGTVGVQVAPIDLDGGVLTGPPILQMFRSEVPAWAPDGRSLAYMGLTANDQRFLAVRALDSNRVRELRPQLAYMPQPQWFPDGKSLAVWGRDITGRGRIVRVDVQTGHETLLATASDIQRVHVSPDGTKIYYTIDYFSGSGRPGRVVEQDVTTGATRDVVERPDGGGAPHLSPDGKSIAIVRNPLIGSTNSGANGLLIVPLDGRAPGELPVPATLEAYRGIAWIADSKRILAAATAPEKALWLVPINGDRPRKLDIDVSSWLLARGIQLDPTGKLIAFFTGQDARELWALDSVASLLDAAQ